MVTAFDKLRGEERTMVEGIEQQLWFDPQQQIPLGYCRRCGGEEYGPGRCARCGEDGYDPSGIEQML